MTIKQQGGVFGRNPSFNDVEAEQVTTSSANVADLVVSNSSSFKGNMALRNSAGTQVAFIAPSLGGSFRLQGQSAEPMTFWINNVQVGEFNNNRDLKINNGNLVIGTSGKGIDFSATSGTGTSELFDDYEEGTYTADLYEDGGSTLDSVTGYYTKIGNVVTIHVQSLGGTTGTGGVVRSNLPFTSAHPASNTLAYSFSNGGSVACFVLNNGTFLEFVDTIGSIAVGNKMIGLDVSAASRTYFSLTYITSD